MSSFSRSFSGTLNDTQQFVCPIFYDGYVLVDTNRTSWIITYQIDQGGHGNVFAAKKMHADSKKYAVKVEPMTNISMFAEAEFYTKCLQQSQHEIWKSNSNVNFLGLPIYHGHGTFFKNGIHYRFVVMDRYGQNISAKLNATNGIVVNQVSVFVKEIIYALWYIHDKGYSHGDVKTANMLLPYKSSNDGPNVYLIDFGITHMLHPYEKVIVNQKCLPLGTLAFCSRDSHDRISTRRGDLESLAFTVLSWFTKLPWFGEKDPVIVRKMKGDFMRNLKKSLATYKINYLPEQIITFLLYVNKLHHLQTPDYLYLINLFESLFSIRAASS